MTASSLMQNNLFGDIKKDRILTVSDRGNAEQQISVESKQMAGIMEF